MEKKGKKAQGEKLFGIFRIFANLNDFFQILESCQFPQIYANSFKQKLLNKIKLKFHILNPHCNYETYGKRMWNKNNFRS